MNKIKQLILASAIASSAAFITSCGHTDNRAEIAETQINEAQVTEVQVTEVQTTELLRTSQSWNNMDLPDYPQGKPEIVAMKYIIPPGAKLNWHHHVSMNHGILVQGELTIIGKDGVTTTIKEGEAVVEMVYVLSVTERSPTIGTI